MHVYALECLDDADDQSAGEATFSLVVSDGSGTREDSSYDWVIRSRSQESTPLSAVLAIAVGWPVKPCGDSG